MVHLQNVRPGKIQLEGLAIKDPEYKRSYVLKVRLQKVQKIRSGFRYLSISTENDKYIYNGLSIIIGDVRGSGIY
jgi:hypothetical protein